MKILFITNDNSVVIQTIILLHTILLLVANLIKMYMELTSMSIFVKQINNEKPKTTIFYPITVLTFQNLIVI